MSIITKLSIDADYHRISKQLYELIKPDRWAIQPNSWCTTTAKTKYGLADSAGVIHINERFIGSNFQSLLEAVLRHEFAHFCVGLEQGHNYRFKQCEQLFKAQFDDCAQQQAKAYSKLVCYKYQLVAELTNGQIIKLKKTHRKHRKYTEYRFRPYRAFYYQQQAVKQFEYIPLE